MAQSEFPYFRIEADDAFERGKQLGEQSKRYVHGSVDVYKETFAHYTGMEWNDVRKLASEFHAPIKAYDPEMVREIEGVAEGAEVPVEDILAINARTEVMFGISALKDKKPLAECTTYFVGAEATGDGHVVMGQNWDWRPRCEETTILAEVHQGGGKPAFVMLAEGGLVGKLGFNSAGIGLAANLLISTLDKGERAVPFHIILRGILNASSIDEAVGAIVRSRRAASANYLVGSADGRGINVETGPGGVENVWLTHPDRGLLGHANTFTCAIPFGDVGLEKVPDSPGRTSRMGHILNEAHGTITRDSMAELLKDHVGHPHSICRHASEEDHPVEQAESVASWAIDLTDLTAQVSFGPPCLNGHQRFVPSFAEQTATVA
jgi:isopenicillin-N N-acyltransferase-like protein